MFVIILKLFDITSAGVMELIAPGDRVRTIGGKLKGNQNGFSLLGPVAFSKTFSLMITLRVQPKVRDIVYLTIFLTDSCAEIP